MWSEFVLATYSTFAGSFAVTPAVRSCRMIVSFAAQFTHEACLTLGSEDRGWTDPLCMSTECMGGIAECVLSVEYVVSSTPIAIYSLSYSYFMFG
jgi:hypothetical protein